MKIRIAVGIETKKLKTWKPGDHAWVCSESAYKSMRDASLKETSDHVARYTWYIVIANLPRFFGSKVVKGVLEDAETTASR